MKRKHPTARIPLPAERAVRSPASDYMTVEEFCEKFGISRKTWATHRPYLKVIRFGNRILIKREEVDRYVDSLTAPATKVGAPKRATMPGHRHP
jgi:excisionase family DNA binding protein